MRAAEEGDVREVSSGCEGEGSIVEGEWAEGEVGEDEGEDVGSVVGIGMLEAVSWSVAKSVGKRPSGIEGGQRRWRLGVEGMIFSWS